MMTCIAGTLVAQQKVTLKQAREVEGLRVNGEELTKLKKDVILSQNQTTIYCDSAYLKKAQNIVEAFGRVKITEGDSITVTASKLNYDGNTKKAELRNNVVFVKKGTATLYTDHLDYDRLASMAYYYNGGRLVDSINQLTSNKGYYNVNSNMASFKKNVHVINPDYTMDSDSLQYNSRTKIIHFRTETKVVNKAGETFTYEGGEYDTKSRQSILEKGMGETPSYTIQGKYYQLDNIRQSYYVRDSVVMTSKEENLNIYGNALNYSKVTKVTKVYNQPWLAKATDDNDTLFINADTLVSIDSDDPAKKRLLAYHNVKIFKRDLQGVADSLVYQASDSMIYFYGDPVLWTEGNQMTADSISMLIEHNTISKLFMVKNSFVVSQDTLLNFNQIKGRNMTATFKNNDLDQVVVEGNGESLYHALNDDDLSFTGVNKIICSNIIIRFLEGRLYKLSFYVQPDASFIPPKELTPENRKLTGFVWKGDSRPKRDDVVRINRTGSNP